MDEQVATGRIGLLGVLPFVALEAQGERNILLRRYGIGRPC